MDEIVDSFPSQSTVQNLSASIETKKLEQLDQDITFVLSKVRKNREPKNAVIMFKKKMKRR